MKETKKQIIARTRNEVAKAYNDKIKNLEARNKRLSDDFVEMARKNRDLRNSVEELNEKISQYEDWINRLQEFCNLSDNEREDAMNRYRTQKNIDKHLSKLMNVYSSLFNLYQVMREKLEQLRKDIYEYAKYLEEETYQPYEEVQKFAIRLRKILEEEN